MPVHQRSLAIFDLLEGRHFPASFLHIGHLVEKVVGFVVAVELHPVGEGRTA